MKKKLQENKQFLAIALLFAGIIVVLSVFLVQYHRTERDECVLRLQSQTEESAKQIQSSVRRAQNYLNKISTMVYDAHLDNPAKGLESLATLGNVDMISRLELLMPDGTLFTPTGPLRDSTLSFADLASRGAGITRRSADYQNTGRSMIRIFTPVRRNGQTVAILFGVIHTDRLSDLFAATVYDGQAKLSLVEGDTGNLLIDPWEEPSGSLWNLTGYKFAGGYTQEQLQQDLQSDHSGTTILRSTHGSSKYYTYYTGIGVQDWTVLLSVESGVAFAKANSILLIFGIMAVLLVVMSVIFLVWFIKDVRRNQARTDLRLRGARYMLDVQQILFRAHTQSRRFEEALNEVAQYLAADATLYLSLHEDGQLILEQVGGAADKAPPKHSDFYALFPQVAKTVMEQGQFSSNRPFLWGDRDWPRAKSIGIRNMMLVRLSSMDGHGVIGVLGAINTDVVWDDTTPLDQVALSFSMAIENYKNYQKLAYMSQVDELTGVMNRNSYESRLEELGDAPLSTCLGCIYIDANGLHEINNHLGHDAGDEMLRAVADTLLSNFPKDCVFRLGGDEFAVLSRDLSKEEMERRAAKVNDVVEKVGYSVSVGLEWQDKDQGPVPALVVAAAEAAMRQAKADHYANQGGERQMRNLNARLEATLNAKRDADALISALAPHFTGVYFVNPVADTCRHIVSADFFLQLLEQAGGSFQGAMDLYIHSRVAPDDQQSVLDFCNYATLVPLLETKGIQEMLYHRATDGALIRLQAKQPRRAGDDQDEIMLLFTPLKPQDQA